LQHLKRTGCVLFQSINFELLVPVRNLDLASNFNGSQMLVQRSTQMMEDVGGEKVWRRIMRVIISYK
jgi:hypothetical protein